MATNPHLEYKSNKHERPAKVALWPGIKFQERHLDLQVIYLPFLSKKGYIKVYSTYTNLEEEWKQ